MVEKGSPLEKTAEEHVLELDQENLVSSISTTSYSYFIRRTIKEKLARIKGAIDNDLLPRRQFLRAVFLGALATTFLGSNSFVKADNEPPTNELASTDESERNSHCPLGKIEIARDKKNLSFRILTLTTGKILAFSGIREAKLPMLQRIGDHFKRTIAYLPYPLIRAFSSEQWGVTYDPRTFACSLDVDGKVETNISFLPFVEMDRLDIQQHKLFEKIDDTLAVNVAGTIPTELLNSHVNTANKKSSLEIKGAILTYLINLDQNLISNDVIKRELARWVSEKWILPTTENGTLSLYEATFPSSKEVLNFLLKNQSNPLINQLLNNLKINNSEINVPPESFDAVGGMVVDNDGTFKFTFGGEFLCYALRAMDGEGAVMQHSKVFNQNSWKKWRETRIRYHEYDNPNIQVTQRVNEQGKVTVELWDMFVSATFYVIPNKSNPDHVEIWYSGKEGANTFGDLVEKVFERHSSATIIIPDQNVPNAIPIYDPEQPSNQQITAIGPADHGYGVITTYPFTGPTSQHCIFVKAGNEALLREMLEELK